MTLERVLELRDTIIERVSSVVVGQQHTVRLMLTALLAEGHVLLEGVPGTGKTLLTRMFANCLSLGFKRIQFTPDLMPGDIVGTNLFDFGRSEFTFIKGPVFTQFLLADEINRTPPKTQAALLEAMQERSVTVDGRTMRLPGHFMVVATQNPIEQEGTYPLPEAQLDRFLFKVFVTYPDRDRECELVRIHGHRTASPDLSSMDVAPVCDQSEIAAAAGLMAGVRLSDEIVEYVVDLVRATREHASLQVGSSPRASNMLACAGRAFAILDGRDFVIPDDIKFLFAPTMRHRLLLAPGTELEGQTADAVLAQIVDQVPAPR